MWHMHGRVEATTRGMVAAEAAFRVELSWGCLLHGTGINLVLLSLVSSAWTSVLYLTFHSDPTSSHTTQQKYRRSRSVE